MPTENQDAGEPAARVRGVEHTYPGAMRALAGVDLDLKRGELTALVGANGAGKSTLLRILSGILTPGSGQVWVLGCEQPGRAAPRTVRALRARVGYVPQDVALDPEMTGRESLELFAVLHGVPRAERRRRTEALAEAFGTAEHLDRRVETYSGGLRRRLHLAAGMIHDPELLLLDEPGAGLDPSGEAFLWAELGQRARRGRAVVVVAHELAAVEREAHTAVVLARGKVIAEGAPRELIARHGRTTVRMAVECSPESRAAIERIANDFGAVLDAPDGSERWGLSVRGDEAPRRLLVALAGLGNLLREVEVRAPSLTSAYAALTSTSASNAEERPDPRTRRGRGA